MSLTGIVCGSEVYDSVTLDIYTGWVKGSSVYMQVGFSKVAYTF